MYLDPIKRRGRGRGLTLIELAVTVTLTTGAMSLLLPTFKDARERAKRMTCQSNLGQIAKGLLGYIPDHEALPIYSAGSSFFAPSYGGWSGLNRAYWQSYNPAFNVQTKNRPLSVYMTPWEIPEQEDVYMPTQEMPLFKCPSDSISSQWQWADYGDKCHQDVLSAYNDVGTSYQMTWQWYYQVEFGDCPASDPEPCYIYHGYEIFQKYIDQDPSRFVILMEDPLGYGVGHGGETLPGIQVQGYHGEFSWHVAAFADGHVEYRHFDSRHMHDSLPYPPGPRHGAYENLGAWSVCDWTKYHVSGSRHN